MIIFQRMQIWGATLLLMAGFILAACGTEPQGVRSDENIVVVYNCNTDDWAAPLAKEFQEQTGIEVDKKKIESDVPIRNLGGYELRIRLHRDVEAKLHLSVQAAE